MNFSRSFIYIYFEVEPSAQDLFSNPAFPVSDHVGREKLPPAADTALADEGALLIISAHIDAWVLSEVVNVEVVGQLGLPFILHVVAQKVCHLINDAWQVLLHLLEPDEFQIWVMSPEPPRL